MSKKQTLGLLCFVLIILTTQMASASGGAGYPAPWLDETVNGKAISLGRIQSTISGKGAAFILNPAELGWTEENYFTLMHAKMAELVTYDLAGVNYGWNSFGLNIGYQGVLVEDIPFRDEEMNLMDTFDNREQAISLGVGRKIGSNLAIGGVVRLLHHQIYDELGLGYGLKLGLKWQPSDEWSVGAQVANPVGKIYWQSKDPEVEDYQENLQMIARAGVAYTWSKHDLAIMGEYVYDPAQAPLHIGIEKGYQKNLRLRAGLNGMTPTFGIGFIMSRLEVDYAFELNQYFGKSQYLSVNWRY